MSLVTAAGCMWTHHRQCFAPQASSSQVQWPSPNTVAVLLVLRGACPVYGWASPSPLMLHGQPVSACHLCALIHAFPTPPSRVICVPCRSTTPLQPLCGRLTQDCRTVQTPTARPSADKSSLLPKSLPISQGLQSSTRDICPTVSSYSVIASSSLNTCTARPQPPNNGGSCSRSEFPSYSWLPCTTAQLATPPSVAQVLQSVSPHS